MDFGLSEEQEMLQQTLRDFADNECPAPRLRELFDGDAGHDPALWKGLVEMGIAGLALPEVYGGAGLEVLDLALASEVMGEAALPGPFFGHALAGLAIEAAGSDAQKERWLPRLASGELTASVALGEADNRWLPEEWTTQLASGRVRGTKLFVPCGLLADLFVVGLEGGRFAVVEKGEGVSLEDANGIDRTRRLDTLVLDAGAELLEGDRAAAERVRDAALVMLAADSFGAAWKLIRMTIEYTSTRKQFDTPLAQFQGVKHQIANAATEIEPTRGLYWYAAHAIDHIPDEAASAASIAKAHITDRAMDVARDAVELHGGIGFTWECDVHMWFKRAMFNRTFLGTPEVHRERTAALATW